MDERLILEPFRLSPCYKEKIWGGDYLKWRMGKTDAPPLTGESWELADHPAGVSRIAEGDYKGKTLGDLRRMDTRLYWGTKCPSGRFPILVKLIDARDKLSIQVHPSDESADWEEGERGKAEMWYVVDCTAQSFLYFGFSRKISEEQFQKKAADGTICDALNKVPVKKGDVFFIQPGTIHAIGTGIVAAEIQQNSDTTFRIYDYQRKTADGKYRELHLKRAAEVINYSPIVPGECHATGRSTFPEFTMTEMFLCKYFRAYCLDVFSEAKFRCNGTSFHHLLCVEGTGSIQCSGKEYPLKKGDSFFLPAALGDYEIKGKCRLLRSEC